MRVFGGGGGWRWQLVARQSHFAPSKSCGFSSPLDFRNCVQQALDPWIKFWPKALIFLAESLIFFGGKFSKFWPRVAFQIVWALDFTLFWYEGVRFFTTRFVFVMKKGLASLAA